MVYVHVSLFVSVKSIKELLHWGCRHTHHSDGRVAWWPPPGSWTWEWPYHCSRLCSPWRVHSRDRRSCESHSQTIGLPTHNNTTWITRALCNTGASTLPYSYSQMHFFCLAAAIAMYKIPQSQHRISSNLSDTSNYPTLSAIFVVLIQWTLCAYNCTFVLNIRTLPWQVKIHSKQRDLIYSLVARVM